MTNEKDNWSADNYVVNAAFVPQLTTPLLQLLQPSKSDTIVDLGCGDGILTKKVADIVSYMYGIDSSPDMIKTARARGLNADVVDVSVLDASKLKYPGDNVKFDKAMSNAAMHWILKNPETRSDVFKQVFESLKPGGVYVCEMGGLGNVAEINSVFVSILIENGFSAEEAHATSPWFFPHEVVAREYLENAGFVVDSIERVYRSTELVGDDKGMENWLELFGFAFVNKLEGILPKKDLLNKVMAVLKGIDYCEKQNKWFAGYVRLRWKATKPLE